MIDTLERREAVRTSPEVAAAKHLARTYGVSMRRRRRVGPVVYDLGHGSGELQFTNDGRLADALLFGTYYGVPSFPELSEVLEYGPAHEEEIDSAEVTVLVLEEIPEAMAPLTGPITLPGVGTTLAVITPEIVIPIAPEPVLRRRRIYSVPVRPVLSLPAPPPTLKERQQAVLDEVPSARGLWTIFTVGMVLLLQVVSLIFAPVVGVQVRDFVVLASIIWALIGASLVYWAVTENDKRLVSLRGVGLY